MDRDLFEGVTSLEQLAAKAIELESARFPPQVWHGAAIARTIDPTLYLQLSGSAERSPSFEEFVTHPDLTVVDASARVFRLRDLARERILPELAENKSGLEAITERLWEHSLTSGDPLEKLATLIVTHPKFGEMYFDTEYQSADEAFDLSRCDSLLDILRERAILLTPRLNEKLVAREHYLSSRLLFLDDFYRTATYFERRKLLDRFRALIAPGKRDGLASAKWLLNIHGKGGTGKTMFLRWVLARHCIPERSMMRTPVARFDIDMVYRALLVRQPWLALLSIASQLSSQLPGARFSSLQGPNETALRNRLHNRSPASRAEDEHTLLETGARLKDVVEESFCSGLGGERAVLIFDTVEELSLHHPAVLGNLLSMLNRIHQRCPGLRIVFSGRYPIFVGGRTLPGLSKKVRTQLTQGCDKPLLIGPMRADESRRYLTDVRRVGTDQPLTDIVKVAKGNPFTLALFADLASARTLTAEEVKTSNVAFAYLIERIIDRIPDEAERADDTEYERKRKRTQSGLRWLLRYAVVRRRLTKKFAVAVLADFVREEIRGDTGRDDETNLEPAGSRYINVRPWKRFGLPIEFDDVWSALESYAGSSSWVSSSGGELELQSEVIVPMRQLLTQNTKKYPIWLELNQKAAEYFEGLARKGKSVGNRLGDALYHRYQAEGQEAGQWWLRYLKRCYGLDGNYLSAVQELADSLFNSDYLDDERRPVNHFTNVPIIDEATLAHAAVESFLALALQEMRWPDKNQPMRSNMSERISDVLRYGHGRSDARARLVAFAAHARGIELPPGIGTPSAVEPGELKSPDEQAATALLVGSAPDLDLDERRAWYAKALTISESAPGCFFPPYFVRSLLATVEVLKGDANKAFDTLHRSVTEAVHANAPSLEISDLMLRAGDLGYTLGRWRDVESLAKRVRLLSSPAHEQATGWVVRLALDRYDYDEATAIIRRLDTNTEPVRHECAADLAAALFRFSDADREYASAWSGYLKLGYTHFAARVLLKHARYTLDVLGAPQRVRRLLDPLAGARVSPEPMINFELRLLLARQYARLGDTARARRSFAQAFALVTQHRLPVARAKATATLLAEGVGTPADVETFARMLRTASAPPKLAALRAFQTSSVNVGTPIDVDLPETSRDMLPQDKLSILAALIFFGFEDRALELLRILSSDYSNDFDVLAGVLRLGRRISPSALAPPDNWTDIWIRRANADPSYAGVVLLEEAERLAAARSTAAAQDLVALAKPFLSELPSDSRWHKLLSHLEALHQVSGNAAANLKRLSRHELLSPDTLLHIELNSDEGQLQVIGQDSVRTSRVSDGGITLRSLISAARTNDLYPEEVASILNEGTGLERVEREVKSILGDGSRFGVANDAVAIETEVSALAAVPWEFARCGAYRFYRTSRWRSPHLETIRYLERAIDVLEVRKDMFGPSAWSEFVTALGGSKNFRSWLLAHIPPRHDTPRVLILEPGAETQRRERRGYEAAGLSVSRFYHRFGFTVDRVPLNLKMLVSTLQRVTPSILHIATSIGEARTPREAFVGGDYGELIRAEELTRAFRFFKGDSPLVILDVVDDPFERGRALLLRNAFAARLSGEATRGVLGIGPYPEDRVAPALEVLLPILKLKNLAIGDLHRRFWDGMEQRFAGDRMEHRFAPALFTADPDLPVWD
jgi:hypothetical protein